MKDTKFYTLTETGKAQILSDSNTCPICGDVADSEVWDFLSNRWEKSLLLCGHGFVFTENMNTTDDAANDDWQESVIIRAQFIQELEALGYEEWLIEEPKNKRSQK